MAAGDGHLVNNFKEQLFLKTIDFVNDVLKVALFSDAYAATQIDGASPVYSTVNEIVASGYTAGGATLTGKTVTQDDNNDRAVFDAADVTWTNLATATIQRAILYDDTTVSKWQIAIWEIATNSNGGNYSLVWSVNGLFYIA